MKKKILLMFLLAMALGTAGCQSKETEQKTVSAEADTSENEESAEDYADYYIENTDITLEELYAANNFTALLENHSSLSYTMESYDADDVLISNMKLQYTMFEGKLWYDSEMYINSISETFYVAGYESEDMPGAEYAVIEEEGGDTLYYALISPREEYQKFASWGLMVTEEGDNEELLEVSTQDGALIVQSRTNIQDSKQHCDSLYYVDPDTHLILYLERTWYSGEGEILNVERYTPVYDEPYKTEQRSMLDITSAEDLCYLTVVIDPAGDHMEVNPYQFRKGTEVIFQSEKEFTMYSDEECTQEITEIDTTVDEDTVFIKLKD